MKKLDESPYMVNLLKPHPTENNAFELLIDADTLIESLEDAGLYDTVAAISTSQATIVYDRVKPRWNDHPGGSPSPGYSRQNPIHLFGSGVSGQWYRQ